jgi:hypothetical protein
MKVVGVLCCAPLQSNRIKKSTEIKCNKSTSGWPINEILEIVGGAEVEVDKCSIDS